MNLFESFYASLYHARKKEGLSVSGSAFSGNLVLSISLFLLTASILGILIFIFPSIGDAIQDILKDTFGKSGGRAIGRILAVLGVALFYPFVRYTIGTDSNYQRILSDCDSMSEEEFKKVSSRGSKFMGICLGSWVIPVAIFLLK